MCLCLCLYPLVAGCGERAEPAATPPVRLPPLVALRGAEIVALAPGARAPRVIGTGEDFALLPDGDVAVGSATGAAITILPREGGLARNLRVGPGVGEVAVSRDGRFFAFAGESGLVVAGRDGRGVRRLIADPARDPDVSPDGQTIAFASGGGLETFAVASGERRSVAGGEVDQPRFAPDGRSIAFVREDAVHVIAVSGGTPRAIGAGECPEWMPDGRSVLVSETGREAVRLGSRIVLRGVRCPRIAPG